MTQKYYTNVYRTGSRLFVREVRNGQRRRFKTEYKPTLYIPSKKESTDFQAPDGTLVEPIQPGTMGECYQFFQKYKDVDNFKIYGNTGYEYTYINEEYPGHIDFKINDLVVCNFDIEVDSKNGFAEVAAATNEVTAITIKSSVDNVFHVFACKPFDEVGYNAEHQDTVIAYHECEDELELLYQFLELWETLEPDIVTGWNIRLYDIPYLVNRISRVMSPDEAKRMSPWEIVRESTVNIFQKQEVVYDLAGIAILDYLLIYRKNVLEPRESYRLDAIAEVELGERKVDYGEYGTLQELYEQNFKKFIDYNIHDVRLVDRIDAKRKLIELQLFVAYHAKVNYVDVLSQVRTWDTNICNHLLAQNIVVPQKTDIDKDTQFTGAYVMKPRPGLYEWIVAEDVQSLYPRLMQTLNIGMETKVPLNELTPEMRRYQTYINANSMVADEDGKFNVNPDAIINGMTPELLAHLQEHNVAVGANGVFYRKEEYSLYSVMIEELFQNRLQYKAQMKKAAKALAAVNDEIGLLREAEFGSATPSALLTEKLAAKAEYETQKSIFDLKQHATKILLNSLYGAMGNQYFRFFDVKNAEAVTTSGQFVIQYIARGIDAFLNKKLGLGPCSKCKPLNPQSMVYANYGPQAGCEHQPPAQKFIVYSDTDSIYITLKTVVDKYHPHGDVMKKVTFVEKVVKEMIQPEINRLFTYLITNYFNGMRPEAGGEYLLMNCELIGDKGIWTAKKRYLVNVRDKEGIRKNPAERKYMGLEIKKRTVPKFCRDAMEESVGIVMDKDQPTLYKYVADMKTKFKQQPVEAISFPRSVNGLEKYGNAQTIYIKGTPFHTKGVLMYNNLLEKHNLTTKYPKIRDGEKMKFFYLHEPNPFGVNAMAFMTKLPPEFGVEPYIDWEMQWQKSYIEPMMLILNAIGWDVEPKAFLDCFEEDDTSTTPIVPDLSHLEPEEDNMEEGFTQVPD